MCRAQAGSRGSTDDEDVDCLQQAERAVVHPRWDAHGAGAGRWGASFPVVAAHALLFFNDPHTKQTLLTHQKPYIDEREVSKQDLYKCLSLPGGRHEDPIIDWAVFPRNVQQPPHHSDLRRRGLG